MTSTALLPTALLPTALMPTASWRSALSQALDLVPDLGTAWIVLALAPLLVAAVTLLTAGRWGSAPSRRSVHAVSVAAAFLSSLGVAGTALQRPVVDTPWIPSLGITMRLVADGLSIPLLLLTSVVGVAAALLHLHVPAPDRHTPLEDADLDRTAPIPVLRPADLPGLATYHACLLLVILGALLAFLAGDAIVFFVGFELVLVPMWVLVARYGDPNSHREGAALRFLLITVLGSTLMLVGILGIATATGTTDFARWAELGGVSLSPRTQVVLAAILLTGFCLKIPVFPLHTWLPWVHATAPTAGSVLLAAVLLKLGTYGIVRVVMPVLPEGFATLAPLLGGLAVAGIIWASLGCLVEPDLKRLIAWSSIAHLGFVVLGLSTGTQTGLQAALYGNVAHGLISAFLFIVVGGLKHRWGTADLTIARAALREATPRLGAALIFGLAAAMGLPGLAGFWGEIGAIYAAWAPAVDRPDGWFRLYSGAAAIGAALAVAYSVRVLREVWSGDRIEPRIPDAVRTERVVLRALGALILLLGVAPILLLTITAPATLAVIGP